MRLFELDPRIISVDGNRRDKIESSNVNTDVIFSEIKKKCGQALSSFINGSRLYKGIRINFPRNVLFTDPKNTTRRSQNTTNYYTLLLDNLPSWKNYPKRSQSLICSTSSSYALSYGDVYLVLPTDGANIAVCPADDIWKAFWFLDNSIMDVSYVNDNFKKARLPELNFSKFIQQSLLKGRKIATDMEKDDITVFNFLKNCRNVADVIKGYDNLYNPKESGFELVTYQELGYRKFRDHEVWTDSPAYMIHKRSDFYKKYLAIYEN